MNACEQAIRDDAPFVAVTGPARTGKTEILVRRIGRLLKEGAAAEEVRVLVPSEAYAREFRRRLDSSEDPAARAVEVMAVGTLCRSVLSDPACQAETGFVPVVLDREEEAVLIDQVSRLSGDYVRNVEIVKFLLREWTEIGDVKPGYLISSEEKSLHDALKDELRSRGKMMRHELANCTVRYLEERPDVLAALRARFVVADGFEAMCKASQTLCVLLCSEGMTAAGDPGQSFEVDDPYPYAVGIEEFAEERQASVHRLSSSFASDGLVEFEQAVCSRLETAEPAHAGGRPGGAVEVVDVRTPEAEADFVAGRIVELSDSERERTLVVVPNDEWGRRIERRLTEGDRTLPVEIATPEHAAGASRATVFLSGVLDGFYPSYRALDPEESVNHRRYYRAYDERRFYSAATRAIERLVVTCPQCADYDAATQAGLKIGRIRAGEDGRIALLRPSEFLGR